jgi:hypothetical protein
VIKAVKQGSATNVFVDHTGDGSITIRGRKLGAHIQVYLRQGVPEADLNFFEGRRNVDELRELHAILGAAIEVMDG